MNGKSLSLLPKVGNAVHLNLWKQFQTNTNTIIDYRTFTSGFEGHMVH